MTNVSYFDSLVCLWVLLIEVLTAFIEEVSHPEIGDFRISVFIIPTVPISSVTVTIIYYDSLVLNEVYEEVSCPEVGILSLLDKRPTVEPKF